jgi:multiple sugar transport system ATP-binding protein
MSQVTIENVSKIYSGDVKAVDSINLEVKDSEFMVIVGPSGCGKTTTLRMIAGLEQISSGAIKIGARVVNDISPKNRDIAMVFQNYALYPHMTVFKNMAFGLKLRKFPKDQIEQKVFDTAKLLGIENFLDRKPKALSGGQRQRVAVGRAIVRDPHAFLFDEPLSNLDAKLRVTTRSELKALHKRLQTTSIYVTHDQVEAMTLGDRICVMYDGKIQQVASPVEVYDYPVNQFVAGFLGSPPMNFFDGIIRSNRNKLVFNTSHETIDLPDDFQSKLSTALNKEAVLGIRPESISFKPFPKQPCNAISAIVNMVEPLGNKMDVYLTAESGEKFVAQVDPHISVSPDQRVELYFDTNEIHLFEPGETGRNLTI